jgi:hypothetical protein
MGQKAEDRRQKDASEAQGGWDAEKGGAER